MRSEDISRILENIDERHVKEAMNYKPRTGRAARFIALAACLAILITSVPLSLMLSREDPHTHDHPNTDNGFTQDDTDIQNDDLRGFGGLQLSDGLLNMDVIMLNNGRIDSDTDTTVQDKYVYEYTPVDEKKVYKEMIMRALPYHGLTELEEEPKYTGFYINNSRYYLDTHKDILTMRVSAYGKSFSASNLVNLGVGKLGYEPGSVKFPEQASSENIFAAFGDQIDEINRFLLNDLDSCWAAPAQTTLQRTVYFWDSTNEKANSVVTNEIKDIDGIHYSLSTSFRANTVKVNFNISNGYVDDLYVSFDGYYKIDCQNVQSEVIDFLAVEIGKRFICGSAEEEMLECAFELEPYLMDVLGVAGLEDSYTFEIRDPVPEDNIIEQNNNFGIVKVATLDVSIVPTYDHSNDSVRLIFFSIDGKTYFLHEINITYCVGGDRYVELITPEKATEKLADGYGIGDAGQGCYICREKYRQEVLEFIRNNMTYELVVLPGVEFETEGGKILYDLPFYKFTARSDDDDKTYVSYVIAINSGFNVKFSVYELNEAIYEHTLSQCPCAADHERIEKEKTVRTEALKQAYIASFPEEEKHKARYEAEVLFMW